MDLFPLWNSLRIALVATVATFFLGIWLAGVVERAPRVLKGILDVILTLPLVLPPTVCGFFILQVFGIRHPLGHLLDEMGFRLVMSWPGGRPGSLCGLISPDVQDGAGGFSELR